MNIKIIDGTEILVSSVEQVSTATWTVLSQDVYLPAYLITRSTTAIDAFSIINTRIRDTTSVTP